MQNETYKYITEALLKVADNRQEELFGQIVIFAGGSGSGKGFVINNLLDLKGKIFDVDHLKELSFKGKRIKDLIYQTTGEDISKLNMKNSEDVTLLHDVITRIGLSQKLKETAYLSILQQPKDRLPNLIFDMTLKDFDDLREVSLVADQLCYDKKNIHVIWVVNDIDTAKAQNKTRDRVVDPDILEIIHEQVAFTMSKIINFGTELSKYFDGKMFIVFNNKLENDLTLIKNKVGNFYISNAKYVQIKKRGDYVQRLDKETESKIKQYTNNSYR